MKVFFDERFLETYTGNPAASPGRPGYAYSHSNDWGGLLSTPDYEELGKMPGSFAGDKCGGRIFAALEGGYNPRSLGEALMALLQGVEKGLGRQGA